MDNSSLLSGVPGVGAGGQHGDGHGDHVRHASAGSLGHVRGHGQQGPGGSPKSPLTASPTGLGGSPGGAYSRSPKISEENSVSIENKEREDDKKNDNLDDFVYPIRRGWADKAKRLGQTKNKRETAEYTNSEGIVMKTRADIINQGNFKQYRKEFNEKGKNKSRIKRDWICSCGRQNFENSKFCKGCRLAKAQGMTKTVEINIDDKFQKKSERNFKSR